MRKRFKHSNKKEKLCTFLEDIEEEKYEDDDEEMEEAAFSRQHYQAIADILNTHVDGGGETVTSIAAEIKCL